MYEKLVELFGKLADTYLLPFVLLLAAGLVLLATGATGGWSAINVVLEEPFWRYTVAVIGGLLILAALALLLTSRTTAGTPKVRVTIDSPSEGAAISVPSSVMGGSTPIPAGFQLWLFNIGGNGKIWPQKQVKVSNSRWQTEFSATNFHPGDRRSFALFLVGASGQALIAYYRAAGEALNAVEPRSQRPWPGVGQLTADTYQVSEQRDVVLR